MLRARIKNSIRSFPLKPIGGGFDPDAQAFITAAGITGETQQAALNDLTISLKSAGIFDKLDFLYPMCPIDGSTFTRDAYSYNLIDTSTFQITWYNNPTPSLNGITGNGSSQYGDTGYNVDTNASLNDHCFGFYGTKTNSASDIGARDANYNVLFSLQYWGVNCGVLSGATLTKTNDLVLAQRTASNALALYQGSSTPNKTSTTASTAKPNQNYFLLCQNLNGTAILFSLETYSCFFSGLSLTTQEIDDLISAIETFNTALGR